MALPVILRAAGQIARGTGRLFGGAEAGGAAKVNPGAGAKGLPVATPVGPAGGGGGAADMFGKALNVLNQLGSAAFSLGMITSGIKSLFNAIISLPAAPIKLFTAALNLVQAPALAIVGALKGMRDSMTALGSSVAEFVQLASPVHVQRFKIAADDLTASIGKILIPVMEFATKLTRRFADVIFTLSGPLQKLMGAFFKPLGAIIDALVTVSSPLINLLAMLIDAFAELADTIGGFITRGLKALGLDGKGLKDSTGAAVRPATIGSVEDYGRKAQQAAFSLGTAAGPEERSAKGIEDIYKFLKEGFPAILDRLLKQAVEIFLKRVPGSQTVTKAAEGGAALGLKVLQRTSLGRAYVDAVRSFF